MYSNNVQWIHTPQAEPRDITSILLPSFSWSVRYKLQNLVFSTQIYGSHALRLIGQ